MADSRYTLFQHMVVFWGVVVVIYVIVSEVMCKSVCGRDDTSM